MVVAERARVRHAAVRRRQEGGDVLFGPGGAGDFDDFRGFFQANSGQFRFWGCGNSPKISKFLKILLIHL